MIERWQSKSTTAIYSIIYTAICTEIRVAYSQGRLPPFCHCGPTSQKSKYGCGVFDERTTCITRISKIKWNVLITFVTLVKYILWFSLSLQFPGCTNGSNFLCASALNSDTLNLETCACTHFSLVIGSWTS